MKTKLLLILIAVIPFSLLGKDFSDIRPSKVTLSMKEGDMEVSMTKKEGGRVTKRYIYLIYMLRLEPLMSFLLIRYCFL